ncbi:DEAD/DEAH box helicase [Rhodococcus tukisamuensis]|uniref:Helicase conserved C-terminal domain-containing protein n=1 Tax=Rhodococcus tukisamuensis TaxID=168276 RepID=A0A1G7B7P9_9NOCA|nr:DEAD/DEAH box helicase [Rhodococcus tukisamuensis]SDE23109.1 Helicase conserved C-terminal domain-containing protein [Rhodococcus tukisamuensis]
MLSPADRDHTLSTLVRIVGQTTYDRGVRYAGRGSVIELDWMPDQHRAVGLVDGTDLYRTEVDFTPRADRLEFAMGRCSCPVRMNCKHAVALTVALLDQSEPVTAPAPPTWEELLGAALGDDAGPAATVPLAVQLALTPAPRSQYWRLSARLARPGKAGWVNANMTWPGLPHMREVDPRHRDVLVELHTLHQAALRGRRAHAYGDKDLDLTVIDSPRLWALLDEAVGAGVELLYQRKGLGALPRPGAAQLCVDIDETRGDLELTPTVVTDDAELPVVVLGFFGTNAHGVLYLRPGDPHPSSPSDWPFRIAPLTGSAPPAMQELVIGNASVTVPAADADRFASAYYPRLTRAATVRSVDDAFTPPTVDGPHLLLTVSYLSGHRAQLHWEFRYTVGGVEQTVELYPGTLESFRDVDGERAVVAGLDLPLEEYGLRTGGGALVSAGLHGLDTARMSTELLPLLNARDDVEVRVQGDAADYRDAGETLQIGVGTEATDDGDWFDLDITVRVEDRPVPFRDLFAALTAGESHLLLPDGAYLSLERPELRRLRELITEARDLHDQDPERLRLSRFQVGMWEELAALGVVERQAARWREQVQGLLELTATSNLEPPASLRATLRPYQLDGFRWLAFLWSNGLGGILADDMGLGKTVQSLALICHAKSLDPTLAPVLIVAPTSVVPNWASEAARFAPHLRVVAVTETASKSGAALPESAEGADVVVTSYTLARLDGEEYAAHRWSMLLLDEAQFVKNHRSKAYQWMRRIEAPTKVAISGTPMENNLMELWSLLSITAPGLFSSPTKFQEYYRKPIETGGDAELLGQLRRRIRPFMLRRTKEQVAADLPEKQEQVLEVELSPQHRLLYDTQLQRERQKILGLVEDVDANRFTILQSLTLLRRLSLDPALIDDKHAAVGSAKIDALIEQLEDVIAGGHRALVFSQFTGFLDRVRTRLDDEGIGYTYLDGSTRNRGQVLDEFKTGRAPVFLISLKAGGFGLNLTEADYCFLLDPWWNPASEAQAVDRTHRIGQTRHVMVYRLIAKDTIEDKVLALQARKSALFASVVDEGGAFNGALSAEDIRELFG